MLVKPTLYQILPFDATVSYAFNFSAIGGSQVTANQIQIIDNSTLVVVYTNKVTSFTLSNTIPANTLTNGKQYKVTIQTFDVNNNASVVSDSILFWCFAIPTITVTNITNGQINAQNYIFQGSYTGTNIDILQSYRYILYDSFQNELISYSEVYGTALTQEIDGLTNNQNYYIQLLCMGQHSQQYQTNLIEFTPNFITPLLSATLTLTNDNTNGAIDITANVIEILGTIESGTVSYINNELIDLNTGNATISFSKGVVLPNNFVLKLIAKNISDNLDIIKIVFSNGYLEVQKSNNRIHVYKYLNNSTLFPSHFASDVVTMTNINTLAIWLKCVQGLTDVGVSVIS